MEDYLHLHCKVFLKLIHCHLLYNLYIKFAWLSLAWLPDKMDWVRGQDGVAVIASFALAKDTVDYQIPDALMKIHGLIHQTR